MKPLSLSLVIPVYNEEKRIHKTFRALLQGKPFIGIKVKEVIFVSDGSTDKTVSILYSYQKKLSHVMHAPIRIVSYKKNHGKGYALKRGILEAKGSYILFADADVATPYIEFQKFLPYVKNNAPIVIGTRKNGHSTVTVPQPLYRQILGKCFTKLAQFMLETNVTDFTCGFKLFSQPVAYNLFSRSKIERWGYDAEIMFLAGKLGYPIIEQAVTWRDDHRSQVNLVSDSFGSLRELIQIRYNDIFDNYGVYSRLNVVKA